MSLVSLLVVAFSLFGKQCEDLLDLLPQSQYHQYSVCQVIFLLIKPVTKINRPENAFYTLLAAEKMLQKVFQSCIFPYSQGREDLSNSYRAGLRGLSRVNALLCIRGVWRKINIWIKIKINFTYLNP